MNIFKEDYMRVFYDYQIFVSQKYGGVSRYFIELWNGLDKLNQNTEIYTKVCFAQNEYYCKKKNVRQAEYKNEMLKNLVDYFNKVVNVFCVSFGKYDIIHQTWSAHYGNRFCKGRLVTTIHDMIHELYLPELKHEIENKKRAIFDSDMIIAISESTKRDILSFYPEIPESKIEVVYHGTNHLPTPQKPNGFVLPEHYILFVGQRKFYKNGDVAFLCMEKLLQKYTDLKMIFVGGGTFSDDEVTRMRNLGIYDAVSQVNVSDSELAYLYQNACCLIYPSLYEGFGFPILEAFDNNCPVICSNTSSMPEVAGEAALLVDPENADEICSCVSRIMNEPSTRERLIEKGRERVKMFTWEETARKTKKVYEKMLVE